MLFLKGFPCSDIHGSGRAFPLDPVCVECTPATGTEGPNGFAPFVTEEYLGVWLWLMLSRRSSSPGRGVRLGKRRSFKQEHKTGTREAAV